jgi:FkbM family methyltransferase
VTIFTKILRTLWFRRYRSTLLRTFVFASTEHDGIIDDLALDTVVDIGANRGQFALCIRRLYPDAEIFSFEPLPEAAKKYLTVFKDDRHTRLFSKAVGPVSGSATIHVTQWDVSSSLLPIAEAQQNNFPFAKESRQETVPLTRLSDCVEERSIGSTALLKLDVQGYELHALQGCADLLHRFTYVYLEASFIELYVGQPLADELITYLSARGFMLACVANLSYGKSRRPIQADFLFSRRPPPQASRTHLGP